jgi:RNA polymerase sigma-70 factor (ECF subfamily)
MKACSADEILVKNILEGHDRAFTQLYERYRRSVYLTAYRVIRHHDDSQDATQEIFTKLYRFLHTWDSHKSKLSTWIHRLALNHSIDCRRLRRRRAESQLPENNLDGTSSAHAPGYFAQSPYIRTKSKEEIAIVRHCIGSLPDMQRKTFIRRYFDERKLVEIAEIEQCKLGTVKTSLHRAKKTVQQVLLKSRSLSLDNMASPA